MEKIKLLHKPLNKLNKEELLFRQQVIDDLDKIKVRDMMGDYFEKVGVLVKDIPTSGGECQAFLTNWITGIEICAKQSKEESWDNANFIDKYSKQDQEKIIEAIEKEISNRKLKYKQELFGTGWKNIGSC